MNSLFSLIRIIVKKPSMAGELSNFKFPYRKYLDERTKLAHESREIPSLYKSSSELEGDREHGKNYISKCKVGDIKVGDSLEEILCNIQKIIYFNST